MAVGDNERDLDLLNSPRCSASEQRLVCRSRRRPATRLIWAGGCPFFNTPSSSSNQHHQLKLIWAALFRYGVRYGLTVECTAAES